MSNFRDYPIWINSCSIIIHCFAFFWSHTASKQSHLCCHNWNQKADWCFVVSATLLVVSWQRHYNLNFVYLVFKRSLEVTGVQDIISFIHKSFYVPFYLSSFSITNSYTVLSVTEINSVYIHIFSVHLVNAWPTPMP